MDLYSEVTALILNTHIAKEIFTNNVIKVHNRTSCINYFIEHDILSLHSLFVNAFLTLKIIIIYNDMFILSLLI
jgi:hypothetical protein